MLKRRMLHTGLAIALVAVSILGFDTPANADFPSSFVAKSVHADGFGALAVEATGGISWYNRSVTLTSVRFYANVNECGYFRAYGYQGGRLIDFADLPTGSTSYFCGGSTGKWFTLGNVPLDASAVPGGIDEVYIVAADATHGSSGWADCFRDPLTPSCYVKY
ncbi:hypothetical protein AB0M47_07055 [Hamadaea sp. NPDC051192]|uniref:hypothetical protein n=1 Tax=Hamadaea sp. NPDC051192 TaxID=3154940 RepID=UPI00342C8D34